VPLYHAAALYISLIMVHYWDVPAVLGIGDRPLSADMVVECLKYADANAIILPPTILEELSQSTAESLDVLRKLSYVGFGGGKQNHPEASEGLKCLLQSANADCPIGNLSSEAGDRLVKNGVTLLNVISATEFVSRDHHTYRMRLTNVPRFTPFPLYWQPDPKLWRYFIYNSELFGCEWRRFAEENAYEQVIVRKAKDPGFQGFFYTFPDAKEYRTKDLYKPHPSLPDHWIYHGRADNIIVFSNGEKLNPTSIETIVMGHPGVKGAIVVGSNRFLPALLVEPVERPTSDKAA
jgi:hypothetical protein